jgi:hypothetical protein
MISDSIVLENYQIDRKRWDEVVSNSKFPNYSLKSYFLDAIHPEWKALVYRDYEMIFPLMIKVKYGIKYFKTPIFIPYLGISFSGSVNDKIINSFFDTVLEQSSHNDLYLDPLMTRFLKTIRCNPRNNQVLNLSCDYKDISEKYSENHKRSIKKAKKNQLRLVESNNVVHLIRSFKINKGDELKELENNHYKSLTQALESTLIHQDGCLIECYSGEIIVCSAFFAFCGNRITYVKGFADSEGRKLGAMHLVIDYLIERYSSTDYIFDFGGSNNLNVAKFNYGFGAENIQYEHVKYNKLKHYIGFKWLKLI